MVKNCEVARIFLNKKQIIVQKSQTNILVLEKMRSRCRRCLCHLLEIKVVVVIFNQSYSDKYLNINEHEQQTQN